MMKKEGFGNILSYVVMVFLCVGLGVLVYMNVRANRDQADKLELEAALAAATPDPTAQPTPTPEPVRNTETTTVALCGDLVLQEGIVSDARREESSENEDGEEVTEVSYDFSGLFTHMGAVLENAAYASCTLDGVLQDRDAYESYQAPAAMAQAIRDGGFDFVSTAADNALLSDLDGLTATITALDNAGLAHAGTYASQETRSGSSGVQYADVNGVKLAYLGYTWATNGKSAADNSWCVNILTSDYMTDQTTVDYDRLSEDLSAAKAGGADLIVCYIYWGDDTQYYTSPTTEQTEVVDYLCRNGADVIVGGGVKTPMPIETRAVERDGKTVNCLVCWSLGNLASCLKDDYTFLSAVVYMDIARDVDRGDVWISAVRYKPLFLLSTIDYEDIADAPFRYRILPLREAIDDYNNGDTADDCLSESVYAIMTEGVDLLRGILGAQFDEADGGVTLSAPAIS